jgi:hypothetical protein
MIAFYGFLRLRKLNRFESYYREIGQIEMLAYGIQEDPAAPTDLESLRANLEGRLTTLKCKVLEDFAEGGLRGEGLMAGIIALINDTRESLAGMVAARNGARQAPTHDNPKVFQRDFPDTLQTLFTAASISTAVLPLLLRAFRSAPWASSHCTASL